MSKWTDLGRYAAGAGPVLLAMLSGCGPADSDAGPGGVTVGEARALDEAAEMLDAKRPPILAPTPTPSPARSANPSAALGR